MRVTSRGFRAWRVRSMSQRQRGDMVILAHIREQQRLSLESCGRPRITEELQKLRVNVEQRYVGHLMRDNDIKIIRTQKYKAIADSNHAFNIAAIYLIRIFLPPDPTRNGQATSPASGAARAGSISL